MKSLISVVFACMLSLLTSAIVLANTDASSGTVAEAIDVGNYIYIRLEKPDMWIAAPSMAVSEGDQIEYVGGMEMRDFYSKSLDRTFESIWFIQNVKIAGRDLEQLHRGVAENQGSTPPQIPKPVAVNAPAPGEIEKLDGGKTIAEIQSDPTALNDQSVRLRAKVIKVSANVMGKNWITLQDGTGTSPNDKLLATSVQMVAPGDLVTVQGVVRNDVDLGSGYRYKVLLEEATFTK